MLREIVAKSVDDNRKIYVVETINKTREQDYKAMSPQEHKKQLLERHQLLNKDSAKLGGLYVKGRADNHRE